jgi:5-methylcytosine-specific restriction endonuclease McrA
MPADAFYKTREWRALRIAVLKRDSYRCTNPGCGSTHRLTVDHIKSRRQHPNLAMAIGNLRTLCISCDNQLKEASSGQRRGHGRPILRGCDASGRPLDPLHPWNARAAPAGS